MYWLIFTRGRYGTTLNEDADNSLFYEPFIVFEIDNVKDNPKLFPIVTLIIMDTFIQKMRLRKDRRKALIIEEAWKAIASKLMGATFYTCIKQLENSGVKPLL
jgi:type IV secretory pathway VirB4 component